MQLLLATGNAHKLEELRRIVGAAGLEIEVLGLDDVAPYVEPAENGATFEDNALIKARTGHSVSGLPTLADDSGIEVDVLNKMPGVRSARWAGVGADDAANLDLLLRQVADVEDPRRTARFVCAVAFVTDDWSKGGGPKETVLRRAVEGRLAPAPRGTNGFGYDPIFIPDGYDITTAEMTAEQKDAISHRGQALRAILPTLESEIDNDFSTGISGQALHMILPTRESEIGSDF